MTQRLATLTILALLLQLPATNVASYAGLGRNVVESALGHLPTSEDELNKEIDRLKAVVENPDNGANAQQLYTLAVLQLNRPDPVGLDNVRKLLLRAVLLSPDHPDALDLWVDLLPLVSELREASETVAARVAQQPTDSPLRWLHARVLAQLQPPGAARQLAAGLTTDPTYGARSSWLLAVIEGEEKDDEKATQHLEQALAGLDDATAELVWASCRLIATPAELASYERTPTEDRADFFRTFWKRRDTYPLTPKNERLGEHLRRLAEARRQYGALTNGRAYLSMHDTFKFLSPDLDFYSPEVVFDYQTQSSTWFDHRGLLLVRHGAPDRTARSSTGVRAETWLYYRWTSRPLMFHLIDRRGVGEHVLSLNLGQATTTGSGPDDPTQILSRTSDFSDLYASRGAMHNIFQQIATSRSRTAVEGLLIEEARMTAGFIRQAFLDDTTNLLDEDDLLPFAAYSANFKAGPQLVDTRVYYAIPEKELVKHGSSFEFDATIIVYDREWRKEIAQGEHHFRYDRPATRRPAKDDLLTGAITLSGVAPGNYHFAFELRERRTGKIGVLKGGLQVDYYGDNWADLSDLLLAEKIAPAEGNSIFDLHGKNILPIPTRTLSQKKAADVYYEIYDLRSAADGNYHYRVEQRVLQIHAKPTLMKRLFGIGMNVAYVFFPYEIFLAEVGMFGLGVATTPAEKGLTQIVDERNAPASGTVSESFRLDTTKYRPGVYQLYVTVKDHVGGTVSTRSVRFGID